MKADKGFLVIIARVAALALFVVGIIDILSSTNFLARAYKGVFSGIVGQREYISGTLAGVIWFTLACIVWGISLYLKKADSNARTAQLLREEMERNGGFTMAQAHDFYSCCQTAGIKNLDTDAFRQKALLLVENTPRLVFAAKDELYIKMYNTVTQELARQADALKRQEKEKELQKENTERQIAELTGREKRIAMLTIDREIALYNRNVSNNAVKKLASGVTTSENLVASTLEPERNVGLSALAGTAIGGAAVGMALAADAIDKNFGIRERNAERASNSPYAHLNKLNQEVLGMSMGSEFVHAQMANALHTIINDVKIKLLNESHEPAELFSNIEFGKLSEKPNRYASSVKVMELAPIGLAYMDVEVTDNGSLVISIGARLKNKLQVAEGMTGVLDGALKAKIFDGEALIGEAYLTLPALGMAYPDDDKAITLPKYNTRNSSKMGTIREVIAPTLKADVAELVKLSGICASIEARHDKNYRVEIEPYKLWVMER